MVPPEEDTPSDTCTSVKRISNNMMGWLKHLWRSCDSIYTTSESNCEFVATQMDVTQSRASHCNVAACVNVCNFTAPPLPPSDHVADSLMVFPHQVAP